MARFILGDPSLVGFSGHCYEYLASLAKVLRAREEEVHMLGNRLLAPEIAARTGALPVITYWCDARPVPVGLDPGSPVGLAASRQEHERALIADLEEADERLGFRRDDVLFINTLRHWPMRGLVRWVERLGAERAPQVVLVLHFTAFPRPDDDAAIFTMYGEAFRAMAASPLSARFHLFADSEELIAEYAEHGGPAVTLAPIPHAHRPRTPPRGEPGVDRPVVVAYVGEARHNKGFHLLPHVVRGFARAGLADRAVFHIQSYIQNPRDPFYGRTMGRMVEPNIRFFPDELDDLAYQDFLEQADLILVPYLTDNYNRQTSGIFAEAMALGTPSIVPRGTWMARQVKRLGGGRLFVPDDPQSLLDATRAAVLDYDTLAAEARSAGEAWSHFHRPEVLADMIVAAAGAPA